MKIAARKTLARQSLRAGRAWSERQRANDPAPKRAQKPFAAQRFKRGWFCEKEFGLGRVESAGSD
jgi:hypothetical protein